MISIRNSFRFVFRRRTMRDPFSKLRVVLNKLKDEAHTFIRFWLPPIFWMGLIFYLSSIPYLKSGLPTTWDLILRKIAHMVEFGVLFLLFARALTGRIRKVLFWAALFSIIYAGLDEYHQTFVFGREGCLRDVVFDVLGVAMSYFLVKSKK